MRMHKGRNPDWNSKIFTVGAFDVATHGIIDNKIIDIADYYRLGKELGFGISE